LPELGVPLDPALPVLGVLELPLDPEPDDELSVEVEVPFKLPRCNGSKMY
jgi:hypothetical protein